MSEFIENISSDSLLSFFTPSAHSIHLNILPPFLLAVIYWVFALCPCSTLYHFPVQLFVYTNSFFFFGCTGSSLWHTSSALALCRLNWLTAYGVQPASPALEGGFLITGLPETSPTFSIFERKKVAQRCGWFTPLLKFYLFPITVYVMKPCSLLLRRNNYALILCCLKFCHLCPVKFFFFFPLSLLI